MMKNKKKLIELNSIMTKLDKQIQALLFLEISTFYVFYKTFVSFNIY